MYLCIYLFIYFWLGWVFVAVHGLFSSYGEWGLFLLRSMGSRHVGSVDVARGLWSAGSVVWRTDLVAPRSSWTRARTCVPCIGRRILSFFFLIISTFNYYLFMYLFILAVLGLHFCARASSSCGKWGPLFIVVRGPLTIVASLVAEHRLQTRRLSSCGSRA